MMTHDLFFEKMGGGDVKIGLILNGPHKDIMSADIGLD